MIMNSAIATTTSARVNPPSSASAERAQPKPAEDRAVIERAMETPLRVRNGGDGGDASGGAGIRPHPTRRRAELATGGRTQRLGGDRRCATDRAVVAVRLVARASGLGDDHVA